MMKKLTALLCAVLMILSGVSFAETAEEPAYLLPMDFSAGPVADPANFGENSYEDETLSVTVEHVWVGKARFNVARVKIADPSQLRIGLAAPFGKKKTNRISTIARDHNAVVAIGGDYYGNEEGGYVVRMGEVYRKKPMKSRDMLVTDQFGDFHIIKNSDAEQLKALMEQYTLINVFNFGPALVIDGELQPMPEKYNYNIARLEPRCAIGQIGPLEYLLVVVDGRGAADSEGATVETVAQFMYDQGCLQAYNLDGGNSALMYFGGENFSKKTFKAERSVSDIIYFATGIDAGLTAEE
ncbi:MAG: phosphodiester glycosidase family protein [Clostridia bacterium]|nr:phosphodiester glycosidase family protein [Clostridia bacterium]